MSQEAQVVKWNCPCGNSYKFHGFTEAKPQRQWVGLTDEEIDYYIVHRLGSATKNNLVELIRACEFRLKEKNT